MKLHWDLDTLPKRLLFASALACLSALLAAVLFKDLVIGAMADPRTPLNPAAGRLNYLIAPLDDHASETYGIQPDALTEALQWFPNSTRLHMRLGEYQSDPYVNKTQEAEIHFERARTLSPADYRPPLMLANTKRAQQNFTAAADAARQALKLAPYDLETRWQLANILLESGDLQAALPEFQTAALGADRYFQNGLETVWEKTEKRADAAAILQGITPDKPAFRLRLAQFLLTKARAQESAAVFQEADRTALLGDGQTPQYLNSLLDGENYATAHRLWTWVRDAGSEPSIWNGGFESPILVDFAQFDWSIQANSYARISLDDSVAQAGRRSLRLDFLGRETTRLEQEIQQLVLVRPGRVYRLDYFVRTDKLTAMQGPRVVVTPSRSKEWLAAAEPVAAGTRDWQPQSFTFVASAEAVRISIQQKPRFSYEDPTSGTVWFDAFTLREAGN